MGRNPKFQIRRDVYIEWEILESKAFQELSATGIRVLLRFLQQRKWAKLKKRKKPIYENSGLVFTYAEAETLSISTSQYHAVLKKLIEVGFIDVEHQGGIHKNDVSVYAISERWRKYGTEDFEPVKKLRVLWAGHDVRSWMKLKDAAGNRSESLRETVAIGRK